MSYQKLITERVFPEGSRVCLTTLGRSELLSVHGSIAGGYGLFSAGKDRIVADLYAAMLTEGTKKRTKEAIQLFLDGIGASVEFSVSHDRIEFDADVRGEHLLSVLSLIAEMLTEPLLASKELSVIKKRIDGMLSLEAEDTKTQATIALTEAIYPKNHFNRKERTETLRKRLKELTKKDLLAFHVRLGGVQTLVVSIAGASAQTILPTKVVAPFRTLVRKGEVPVARVHTVEGGVSRTVLHIKEKASADYMIGRALSITKKEPEYVALMLALRILGKPGGFTGRLMQTVRERDGLTYGTYAFLRGFDAGLNGYVTAWATFAPSVFAEGRAAMKREISRLRTSLTDLEIQKHQALFTANWKVMLSTPDALADAVHSAVIEEGSPAYLDELPKKVAAVTPKEVRAAISKYLLLEGLSEAVAGTIAKDALDH